MTLGTEAAPARRTSPSRQTAFSIMAGLGVALCGIAAVGAADAGAHAVASALSVAAMWSATILGALVAPVGGRDGAR